MSSSVDESSGGGDDTAPPRFDLGEPSDLGGPEGGCSADLQDVLGPDGEVVMTCAPELACLDGACVEPCVAAGESSGSLGCEFWVPTPAFAKNEEGAASSFDGACHAVMLANGWPTATNLEVTYQGQAIDPRAHIRIPRGLGANVTLEPLPPEGVPPGEVAILFLSHQPDAHNGESLACPVPPVFVGNAEATATDRADAFEIVADHPITAYDIIPYGGALTALPSASLLFPRTSWGSNYVLSAPHKPAGRAWLSIVASEDDTSVTVNAQSLFVDGELEPPEPNQPTVYTLEAGEYIQLMSHFDLAGTLIESDRPVGVFSGNLYLNVKTEDSPSGGGQDSSHQQVPHVQAMGSLYVASGVPSRLADEQSESVLYRFVGAVEGTELRYHPSRPPGAPEGLAARQVEEFETRELFTVTSQDSDHPFAMSQYMSGSIYFSPRGGCAESGADPCHLGDEEWVSLLPAAQFLDEYVFFVDPTYGVSSLSIVRVRGEDGFVDVEVDCVGVIDGWTPVDEEHEVAHLELYRSGYGGCDTSQQHARSAAPFGVMVWGMDRFASYAYPAGGNARSINDVHVPAG